MMKLSTLLLVLLLASPGWAQPVSHMSATVELVYEDYADASGRFTHAIERTFLVLPDGTRVRVKGEHALTDGARVTIEKARIRKADKAKPEPALTEAEIDVSQVALAPTIRSFINPAMVTEVRKVTHILVRWTAPEWISVADAQVSATAADDVTAIWSYGLFRWQTTVLPWITIPSPTTAFCDHYTVVNRARSAALAAGYVIEGTLVTEMQQYPQCNWSGIGGGSPVLNGGAHSRLHELGHALGFGHSDAQSCSSTGCQHIAYGSPYSRMGRGTNYDETQKVSAGWIVPQTITASGEYLLDCFEPVTSGAKVLRVLAKPHPTGYANPFLVGLRCASQTPEVVIHNSLFVLDMDQITADIDWTLDQGQPPFVLNNGTTIETVSRTTAGATIRVTIAGIPPAPTPPTITGVTATSPTPTAPVITGVVPQ